MSIKLTKKQKLLLDYLTEFTATHGVSPSYREIAAGLGLKSPASVAEHIDHLVALGAIKRDPGSPRSLEVVDLSYPETTALFQQKIATASGEDLDILQKCATILGIDLGTTADSFPISNHPQGNQQETHS